MKEEVVKQSEMLVLQRFIPILEQEWFRWLPPVDMSCPEIEPVCLFSVAKAPVEHFVGGGSLDK